MDNIKRLVVPRGIRYISDWKDYSLEKFQFPHILDKKIPGCGYTEYCITCDLPIVLCSPRKILLENKEAQHSDKVFYFKNEFDIDGGIDKDITKQSKSASLYEEADQEKPLSEDILKHLESQLEGYLMYCLSNHLYPKILVTYDSFRLVKDYLRKKGCLDQFYIVIDEMQAVFTDSRFKASTELEFVNQLQGLNKVCFVSATPMIDKYLKRINEFKDLPYFEIDWGTADANRIIKPKLRPRVTQSITGEALKVISKYKAGDFDTAATMINGNISIVTSNEVVFYVNSVVNIIAIIKKAELKPEEVNILCARTPQNEQKIHKKLGRKFNIGAVPLKGEPHKMFTFCTRTVYLGADFYSTCAETVILSDANIDSLAVDITLDLPQILGRQRLNENPWKNKADLFYKTLKSSNSISQELFDSIINEKYQKTIKLLNAYNEVSVNNKHVLAEEYQYIAVAKNYRDHYVAVNRHNGNDLVPCLNNLVLVAEQRAFDIQQIDYADRFTVFNTVVDNGLVDEETKKVTELYNEFDSLESFKIKMRFLCELRTKVDNNVFEILLDQVPLTYKTYYLVLGPEKLYSIGYDVTKAKRAYEDTLFDKSDLETELYRLFPVGSRNTKSDIKETLAKLYDSLNYHKTPKANDLEEYFNIKHCNVYNTETKKYDNGFEIISRK